MAQLNDTMVQGDLRVTGTVFGTTANIPDIYTNDKIAYGDAAGQSVVIASRVAGGLTNMNVHEGETTSLNGFVTPLTKYSKVSSDSYKCEFDSIIGGNDGTTDYPMWHHVTYAGTNSWTSNLTRLLTATNSITSTDELEPLLTASRGVVKSTSDGVFPSGVEGTSPSGNILGFNCVSWASLGANQYGIVFRGDNARTGLTYNNSYILGTNASFNGVGDIGYDSTSHYFQGMSQSAGKAKYADSATSAASSVLLAVPRKTGSSTDLNSFPTSNSMCAAECGTDVQHSPASGSWTYVMSLQGNDAAYAGQIGLGMTTDGLWYRRKSNNTWSSWQKTMNTSGSNKDSNALQNLLDPLGEGTSNFTDGTELLTSYADNRGFATPGHVYEPYRRKASSLKNYIAGVGGGVMKASDTNFTVGGMCYGDFANSGTAIYGWKIGSMITNTGWSNGNLKAIITVCDWSDAKDAGAANFIGIIDITQRMDSGTVALSNWKVAGRLYSIIPQQISASTRGWAIFAKADSANYTYTYYIGRNVSGTTMNGPINYSKISIMPIFEFHFSRACEEVTSAIAFTGSYDKWWGEFISPAMVWDQLSVGSDTTPVYVNSSKKIVECSNVSAKKIYDWNSGTYMKLYVGGLGADSDTIYIG